MKTIPICFVAGLCLAAILNGQAQTPPEFFQQPTNLSLSLGATATFRVYVPVGDTVGYQWYANGAPIPAATLRLLTITNVQLTHAGDYYVVATNLYGSATSQVARLEVDPLFTKQMQGTLVADGLDGRSAAWGDIDGDGDLDLAVVGGMWYDFGTAQSLLYTNRGGGLLSQKMTLDSSPQARASTCNWMDIDNDGDLDLWVGAYETQRPLFWTNEGVGRLKLIVVTTNWVKSPFPPRGALQAWADFDRDGFIDLALVPLLDSPQTQYPIQFLRNQGDGTFTAVTNGLLAQMRKRSSSASWVDYDGDGDLDLLCAGSAPTVFRNDGGVLVPVPEPEVQDLNLAGASMDAWADFDNDGDLDVLVTRGSGGSRLCRNDGGGRFTVLEGPEFAALQRAPANYAAWGDYDNDGDLDVIVTYGEYGKANRNQLFRNDGAAGFSEVLSGSPVNDLAFSTVPTWADIDGDGDLDLFVVNAENVPSTSGNDFLYLNNGGSNAWLEVKLTGRFSNRCAIGAKVRVKTTIGGQSVWQLRTISAQAWSQSLVAHFGLGNASLVEVLRVEWPSGVVEEWTALPVNEIVAVEEALLATVASVPETRPGLAAVPKGNSVQLSLSAGLPGSSYQWLRNGQAIPGATALSLGLSNFAAPDIGEYAVVVTSETRKVTCRPLRLEMEGRATIVGPYALPAKSVSAGENLQLWVKLTAAEPYTCQWQRNGIDIHTSANATATSHILEILDAKAADSGDYRLIVHNAVEDVTSVSVSLQVDPTFTKIMSGPIVEDTGEFWAPVWGDYDNDGLLDLLVSNGGFQGNSLNALYRNLGNGAFQRISTGPIAEDRGNFYGGTWGDFDNDGNLDLFVGNIQYFLNNKRGTNYLYQNLGGGVFTRHGLSEAMRIPIFAEFPAWIDYDKDGYLDLFFVSSWSTFNSKNSLFHSNRDGSFTAVTNAITTGTSDSELAAWADYDNDGRLDLLISAHSRVLLYHQESDGSFTRITEGPLPKQTGNSSGPAWGDYDNDGFLDLFLGDFITGGTNLLFHNLGNGSFERIVLDTSQNTQGGAWGDYDNDGRLDLFVFNGSGFHNVLYRNLGNGQFSPVPVGSLVSDGGSSSGCSWGDYDNDGFLDLVVSNGYIAGRSNSLYHNNGNTNHWLMVRLIGTVSNRSAIGARVHVVARIDGQSTSQMRESCYGTYGQGDLRSHFGLGDATTAETVRIEWPSGIVQELKNVAANQFLTVTEPSRLIITGPGQFQIQCWKGMAFTVEASSDLVNWTPLGTVTNETGTLTFPVVPSGSQQFYRTKTP